MTQLVCTLLQYATLLLVVPDNPERPFIFSSDFIIVYCNLSIWCQIFHTNEIDQKVVVFNVQKGGYLIGNY